MILRRTFPLFAALALLVGCGDKPAAKPAAPADAHGHGHEPAPNGGELLELGDHEAHLELMHDHAGGNVTVWVFGKDLKTKKSVAAPTIVIQTKDGPKEFTLTAAGPLTDGTSHVWKGSHAGLIADPWNGRIRVTIDGKDFQSPLEGEVHKH